MFFSLNIRRLTGTVVVVGAFAALVPLAEADSRLEGPDAIDRAVAVRQAELRSGFQGSPDAIDRAVAARQDAAFDIREQTRLRLGNSVTQQPDVVDRAVRSHEAAMTIGLESMPDLLQRTAAAGSAQYLPSPTIRDGFDWNDFGVGAGAGIGAMLFGLGAILVVLRGGRQRVRNA